MERAVNKPIQLIASFSKTGEIQPLWFKFERDDQEAETIKIEGIHSHKKIGPNHISYVCWVVLDERQQLVEFIYHIQLTCWELRKILG